MPVPVGHLSALASPALQGHLQRYALFPVQPLACCTETELHSSLQAAMWTTQPAHQAVGMPVLVMGCLCKAQSRSH